MEKVKEIKENMIETRVAAVKENLEALEARIRYFDIQEKARQAEIKRLKEMRELQQNKLEELQEEQYAADERRQNLMDQFRREEM